MAEMADVTTGRLSNNLTAVVLEPYANSSQNVPDMVAELVRYVLLRMPHTEQSKQEMFAYIQEVAKNDSEYSQFISEQFSIKYQREEAIHWYSKSSFLFQKLNEALRKQDIEFLYKTRDFLFDLHHQLKKLHLNFDCKQMLYHGYNLEDDQVEKLSKNINGLVCFDQFISTSIDKDIAKGFIKNKIGHIKGVLLQIDISKCVDSIKSDNTPIAYIESLSENPNEKEVLFSPGSVFRINNVRESKNERIFYINLELTIDRDQELKEYSERIKKDIHPHPQCPTNLIGLAKLLKRFSQYDNAIKFYDLALLDLDISSFKDNIVVILIDTASIYLQISDIPVAERLTKQAEEIYNTSYSSNHQHCCAIWNLYGRIYLCKGATKIAREYYHKVIGLLSDITEIDSRIRPTTLNNIAVTYIAETYFNEGLEIFEKILKIQKEELALNDPDIARTYNNMAVCYLLMKNNSKAKEYADQALEIKSRSLPNTHISVSDSKINRGIANKRLGMNDNAYADLEDARDALLQVIPPNAPVFKHLKDELNSILFHASSE